MAVKEIDVEVKDQEGNTHITHIEVNEEERKGKIGVGDLETTLTDLRRSEDGQKMVGKTKYSSIILKVTITIDCEDEPPDIEIVAKKWPITKKYTYVFTHEEQDKLVEWIKGLDIPIL
ncbi:MAG: hypothetical protein V3V94_01580 [Candidatus Brocadiales bacterium]